MKTEYFAFQLNGVWRHGSKYCFKTIPADALGPFDSDEEARQCALLNREADRRAAGLFNLSDFALSRKFLIAWLNADGNPPQVVVSTSRRHQYGMGYKSHSTTKPVADEQTLDIWWRDYRQAIAEDWSKSPLNTNKPQTHKQFLGWCLKEVGIKAGGTIEERIKRAVERRPDLYIDAEALKAQEEEEKKRSKDLVDQWRRERAERDAASAQVA